MCERMFCVGYEVIGTWDVQEDIYDGTYWVNNVTNGALIYKYVVCKTKKSWGT